ncbi:MAG: hypothetical protein H6739_13180 [Alphaproteobacteria bacterium]|nr:hypothetical protein [Alphaproteobacteria bacterium]
MWLSPRRSAAAMAALGVCGVAYLGPAVLDEPVLMAKIAFVLAAWGLLAAVRLTDMATRGWGRLLLYVVFVGNIGMMWTVEFGALGPTLNGLAALILIIAAPLPRHVSVSSGPERRMVYPLTLPWVAVYTLWNACVLLAFRWPGIEARDGSWGALAVAQVLGILLACRLRPEHYLEARVQTLALVMMATFVQPIRSRVLLTPGWLTPEVTVPFGGAAVLAGVVVVGHAVWRVRRGDPPLTPLDHALVRLLR